jgi:hypothetical protein
MARRNDSLPKPPVGWASFSVGSTLVAGGHASWTPPDTRLRLSSARGGWLHGLGSDMLGG